MPGGADRSRTRPAVVLYFEFRPFLRAPSCRKWSRTAQSAHKLNRSPKRMIQTEVGLPQRCPVVGDGSSQALPSLSRASRIPCALLSVPPWATTPHDDAGGPWRGAAQPTRCRVDAAGREARPVAALAAPPSRQGAGVHPGPSRMAPAVSFPASRRPVYACKHKLTLRAEALGPGVKDTPRVRSRTMPRGFERWRVSRASWRRLR